MVGLLIVVVVEHPGTLKGKSQAPTTGLKTVSRGQFCHPGKKIVITDCDN